MCKCGSLFTQKLLQPNNIAGIALTFYEAMHFEEIFAAGSQKSTKIIVPNNKEEKTTSIKLSCLSTRKIAACKVFQQIW